VAGLFGDAMRQIQRRDGDYMREHQIDASASFIVGGQIRGEDPRLFLVYTEGNFIESSAATSYFQIGEIKYGKPIIDRILHRGTSLADAVKLTLISFDSTMRSNVSVGTPIDLVVYQADSFAMTRVVHIEDSHPYLATVRASWNQGLRRLFDEVPKPDWLD
jgi:putative proteasome-type protease